MKYISILIFSLILCVCSTTKTVKEEPFTVDFNSPKFSAGTLEAQFDKLVSLAGLRQVEVTVDYYPLEDAVCLQYRIDFMSYYQFWDRNGRAAFFDALEQYKEDYTQKNLAAKGNKNTRRKYGKVDGYLIWQSAAFTIRAKMATIIDLGYDIKEISRNKASFFSIFQRETVYIEDVAKTERRTAPNMQMYLTRAKADELAEFFNQDFLNSLVPERIKKGSEPSILDTF